MLLNILVVFFELIVLLLGKRNVKKIQLLKNWIFLIVEQKNIDLVDWGVVRWNVIISGQSF